LKILLVEDNKELSESLSKYLTSELFEVACAYSFREAKTLDPRRFDLIILDWNLGDGQGIDLMKIWNSSKISTPTLFLTAKSDVADKVLSLESGACDYLTKPFEPRELLARIRVQLRKQPISQDVISINEMEIDLSLRQVVYLNKDIFLSKTEFELLYFLAKVPDKVFSRDELLKEVWGYNSSPTTRTVDTHILQLRQKLHPDFFETVHGVGYRLKRIK
jgi:DNA-binding response OmpR family regulator